MIQRIISALFFMIILCQAYAQETIYGLESNPIVVRKYNAALTDAGKNYIDTVYIALPFYDDFSEISVWPSPLRWADNFAFINTDYALNPLTIGVATMDAIDEKGSLYPNSGPYPFNADLLTSQPLRLDSLFSPTPKAITRSDSLYLSFYYQPQGRGAMPSKKDSLILEFHSPLEIDTLISAGDTLISPRWHSVWSSAGGMQVDSFALQQNRYFRQVLVPVKDSALYYRKGFRFRFRNIASLASANQPDWQSNGDQWNLDIIYLNTGRSINDTVLKDVAFADRAPSMLRNYESMPYSQYKENWVDEMQDTVSIKIANLDKERQNIAYRYNVRRDSELPFKSYDGGSYSISPFATSGYVAYQPFARPMVNFFYSPFENEQKIVFHTTHFLTTDPSLLNQVNDTIRYTQVFSNYYAYDDGTAEAGIGLNGASGSYAVRFQLNKEDTLRGIQIYLNQVRTGNNLQDIDLVIWNDSYGKPGHVVKRMKAVVPMYSDSLNTFHTYWFDSIQRINELDFPGLIFYAGWQQTGLENLNVGFDRYTDSHLNRFFSIDGTWQMSDLQHSGSLMLRPVIGLANPVGIEQQRASTQLQIFPNPVSDGRFSIKIPENWNNIAESSLTVSVYSASGKLVFQSSYLPIFQLDQLAPGIYLVKMQNKASWESAVSKMMIR